MHTCARSSLPREAFNEHHTSLDDGETFFKQFSPCSSELQGVCPLYLPVNNGSGDTGCIACGNYWSYTTLLAAVKGCSSKSGLKITLIEQALPVY